MRWHEGLREFAGSSEFLIWSEEVPVSGEQYNFTVFRTFRQEYSIPDKKGSGYLMWESCAISHLFGSKLEVATQWMLNGAPAVSGWLEHETLPEAGGNHIGVYHVDALIAEDARQRKGAAKVELPLQRLLAVRIKVVDTGELVFITDDSIFKDDSGQQAA